MSAFESLRPPDRPVAPDRRFADELRARLTASDEAFEPHLSEALS